MRIRFQNAIATVGVLGMLALDGMAQSGGALSSTAGVTGTTAPFVARPDTGFAVQNGVVYFLRNNRVLSVNEELLPPQQIMTDTGRLLADGPGIDGFTLENGTVYYTRSGVRRRIDDPGFIPGGQIMTLDGGLVMMPTGVVGFPGSQAITIPSRGPAPATSSDR